MKTLKILDRKTGNLLVKITCYDKKTYEKLRKNFNKIKQVNVVECDENV